MGWFLFSFFYGISMDYVELNYKENQIMLINHFSISETNAGNILLIDNSLYVPVELYNKYYSKLYKLFYL